MSAAELYLTIDGQIVGGCTEAVKATFETLFSCHVQLSNVQIEFNAISGDYVTGLLPFGQKSLEGVIAVSFPRTTLASLLESVYRVPEMNVTDEMKIGTVSEVVNIVFGLFKERFNKSGYKFQPSFPVVVMGDNHLVFSTFPSHKLHLRFDSDYGPFAVQLATAQSM